ncbi:hypothetical protein NE619_18040, partial [Anaerovorax odorimutans]
MFLNKYHGFLRRFMPLTDGDGGTGGGGSTPEGQQQAPQQNQQPAQPPAVDYDKIQKMLEGTLSAKEDTALKAYFKQQGLSQEEMGQAIAAYKEQKAQNTPDVTAIQQQAEQAQKLALQAQIEKEALLMGAEIGVDIKTMPYLIKLADMTEVVSDGKIDNEKLKMALTKVLEDVPQLKPKEEAQQSGFRQIGVGQQQQAGNQPVQEKTVPAKRWNRWN